MHHDMFARTAHSIRRTCLTLLAGILAMTAAACAGGVSTATSPSAVSPADLNAGAGVVKSFTLTMSPVTLTANVVNNVTLTVTNTGSGSGATIGSVQVTLPAGLTPGTPTAFAASAGKTWSAYSVSGQVVLVGASGQSAGSQRLEAGESVSFTLPVTSTVCDNYTVPAAIASNSTPDAFTVTTDWTNQTGSIAVTVSGCAATCPAAPAVANAYLDSLGFTGARGWINDAVAQHMTQGAHFDGFAPCDSGYEGAVIQFVQVLMGT